MLQLVLTKQELIHVCSTNYKKSNASETRTETHVSPDGDFSLYDSTVVSVRVSEGVYYSEQPEGHLSPVE